MGLSENRVYSQTNSHLIGIMISKTIGFRGLAYFQTHPYGDFPLSDKRAAQADPFFMGSCSPVACPEHSTGTNVPGGCECLAGADSAPGKYVALVPGNSCLM